MVASCIEVCSTLKNSACVTVCSDKFQRHGPLAMSVHPGNVSAVQIMKTKLLYLSNRFQQAPCPLEAMRGTDLTQKASPPQTTSRILQTYRPIEVVRPERSEKIHCHILMEDHFGIKTQPSTGEMFIVRTFVQSTCLVFRRTRTTRTARSAAYMTMGATSHNQVCGVEKDGVRQETLQFRVLNFRA